MMDYTALLMNLSTDCEVLTYLAQKTLDALAETQAAINEALTDEAPPPQG